MQVRQPKFDFSNTRAHWAPVPEFAQAVNASGIGIPPLERFLNRVMARARKEITGTDPASAQLRSDITTFIRQESCHYATHDAMIDRLVELGYPGLRDLSVKIEAHYQRLLETRGLRFLVGYCEGFETVGPIGAEAWCGDRYAALLEGADPEVPMMMRWHLMEEYEHRTVCFDTFKAMGGGYFERIWCFFYQLWFLRRFSGEAEKYLLSVDRARMSPEELAASIARQKQVRKVMRGGMLRSFLRVLKPSYRPHDIAAPKFWHAIQDEIARDWMGQPQTTAANPQPA